MLNIYLKNAIIAFSKSARVFSSKIQHLASAPKIQLQNTNKKNSNKVVIGFMQDYI